MHGLPRRAEPGFHFGTHRDPLDKGGQDIREKGIPLVSAIVPDGVAEKALANAQTGFMIRSRFLKFFSAAGDLLGLAVINADQWRSH